MVSRGKHRRIGGRFCLWGCTGWRKQCLPSHIPHSLPSCSSWVSVLKYCQRTQQRESRWTSVIPEWPNSWNQTPRCQQFSDAPFCIPFLQSDKSLSLWPSRKPTLKCHHHQLYWLYQKEYFSTRTAMKAPSYCIRGQLLQLFNVRFLPHRRWL